MTGEGPRPAGPALARRKREVEAEIFARRPEHAVEPTLDRISALASLLGDPQRAYPVIHVTGTNGKTSTARMIETLLRARGLRTGLFTSPHLSDIRERIIVDGEPLPPEAFVATYDDVAPYVALVDEREPVRLSFFEVLTAMAFAAFADAPVDVAVVEVGLGGTWDATNIADGAVAVVTPVSIDHTALSGRHDRGDRRGEGRHHQARRGRRPRPAAARGGRGPAAPGRRGGRHRGPGGPRVRRASGRELAVGGQPLTLRGLRGEYGDLLLPLFGAYQATNAAFALAAVEAFASGGPGGEPLGEDLVREAFAMVTSPGRLEVLRRSPLVIVDSAHNPAGMAASVAAVTEAFSFRTLIAVLAISEDKDVPGVLDQLEPVRRRPGGDA